MQRKNYSDNFEDIYLRHDHLAKAGELNGDYYVEFKHIIDITARHIFDKFKKIFVKVGFNVDDIKSISAVYALSYMELYSIRNEEGCRERFIKNFKSQNGKDAEPTEEDIMKSEIRFMIRYLRHKLRYCATVCERKKRNIVGGSFKHGIYAYTEDSVPASTAEIMSEPSKYGYRKVTKKEWIASKKQAKKLGEKTLVDKEGFEIFNLQVSNHGISKAEYQNLVINQRSEVFNTPEDILIKKQQAESLEQYKENFIEMSEEEKELLLKRFIRRNKSNNDYKKEVSLAKKLLKNSDFMVLSY